jgi:hypothetical protein
MALGHPPPPRLVLIHPHTDSFDFIGLHSHSPVDFVAAVRGAAPTVEVEAVEPGAAARSELFVG